MHVEFLLGETETEAPNEVIKLMIHMETEEEALKSIDILEKGGRVISELAPHPEPDDGGMECCLLIKSRKSGLEVYCDFALCRQSKFSNFNAYNFLHYK